MGLGGWEAGGNYYIGPYECKTVEGTTEYMNLELPWARPLEEARDVTE